MKALPTDRLPKGTRRELLVLGRRCELLVSAGVTMPRSGIQALKRVVRYLEVNDVEGGKLKHVGER